MPDHKRLEDYCEQYRGAEPEIPESECQCTGDCECWDIVVTPGDPEPVHEEAAADNGPEGGL